MEVLCCDICGAWSEGTRISALKMRAAVLDEGFNPFSIGLATGHGDPAEDFEWWKSMLVAQDASDWFLCDRCQAAINPYLAIGVSSPLRCPHCGRERTHGGKFCVACGKAFTIRSSYEVAKDRASQKSAEAGAAQVPLAPAKPRRQLREKPDRLGLLIQNIRIKHWRVRTAMLAAIALTLSICVFSNSFRRNCILAHLGSSRARYFLGAAYKSGTSVSQDYAEAGKWFKLAADAGFAPAQFEYGVLQVYQIGNDGDQYEGVRYIEKAAEAEVPEAQFLLSRLLLDIGPSVGVSRFGSPGCRTLA